MSLPDKIRANNLAIAWMIAVVLGACAISFVGGQTESSGRISVWRLLLPVVFMLCYLMYGLSERISNTTKLADSLYFMGFLWTLYALIDSLVFKVGEIDSKTVFVVFGYALVTTGMGMFLRLLLIQFQRTIPDQLLESREEIEKRVSSFTEELNKTQGALAEWRRLSRQGIDTWARDLSDSTGRLQVEIERLHRDSILRVTANTQESIMKELNKTQGALAEWRRLALQGIDTWTRDLSDSTGRLQVEIERLHTEGIPRVTATVQESIAKVADVLGGLNHELSTLKAAVAAVSKQTTRGSIQLETRLTNLDQVLDAGSDALSKSMNALSSKLQEVHMPEDMVLSKFNAAWSKVEPSVLQVGHSLDSVNRSVVDLQKQSSGVAGSLFAVSSQLDALRSGTISMQRLLETLEKHNLAIEAEVVSRSATLATTVDKAIIDVKEMGHELQTVVTEVLRFVRKRMADKTT